MAHVPKTERRASHRALLTHAYADEVSLEVNKKFPNKRAIISFRYLIASKWIAPIRNGHRVLTEGLQIQAVRQKRRPIHSSTRATLNHAQFLTYRPGVKSLKQSFNKAPQSKLGSFFTRSCLFPETFRGPEQIACSICSSEKSTIYFWFLIRELFAVRSVC